MDNPLEQPVPEDPIARVHAFALDLAWGLENGLWGPGFRVLIAGGQEMEWLSLSGIDAQKNLRLLRMGKWKGQFPASDMMIFYGYFEPNCNVRPKEFQPAFILTKKARLLLEETKPVESIKVFVAYKRSESTGLASFLEEGLENSDLNIEVFTDKKIPLGDRWEERLERSVRECDVFICLFGMKTLESDYVRDEIEWALDSDCRFIPILHNGYKGEGDYAELLRTLQGPPVYEESIKAYRFTLIDLLDTLRNLSAGNNI